MTICLVVEVDNVRLRELVLRPLDKIVDGGDMRKRLHAKLAIESPTESIEDLILFLGSVPHY